MIALTVAILLPNFESPSYTPGIVTIPMATFVFVVDNNPDLPDTTNELIDFIEFFGFLWAAPVIILLEILLVWTDSVSTKWILRTMLFAASILFILTMHSNRYFAISDFSFSQLTYYILFGVIFAEILIMMLEGDRERTVLG